MQKEDSTSQKCLNCGEVIAGNYCQNCGQSTGVHRITFKETVDDFFSSTFALEGPLISTIVLMVVNPGRMLREFIEGRRKTYYKPVAFFVLITAIYLIIRSLIEYDPLEGQMMNIDENSPASVQRNKKAAHFMVANINNIMLFLAFSIGISQKLFFRKRYLLAEYVTIGFYITGIYTLVGMMQMLVDTYIIAINRQGILLFLVAYIFYVSYSFHQRKSLGAIIKYLLIGVLSIIMYIVIGYSFSLLVVSLQL